MLRRKRLRTGKMNNTPRRASINRFNPLGATISVLIGMATPCHLVTAIIRRAVATLLSYRPSDVVHDIRVHRRVLGNFFTVNDEWYRRQ